MNFSVLVAASLLALFAASAEAGAPRAVCFTKSQKCCFKFFPCGFVVKKVKKVVRCDFKKCEVKCTKVCKDEKTKVPKKVCDKYHKCVIKYIWVVKKVCKPVCKKVCVLVKANCIKFQIFRFIKFCPKLSCGKFVITGSSKKPYVFVSKVGKLIKTENGHREIIKH